MRLTIIYAIWIFLILVFGSCRSPRHLGRTSIPDRFLENPAISDTHVGIAIYDTESREYIYTHSSDKFFVPASNVKLLTLYAGLKYLGDSIPGIQYFEYNDTIFLNATGDPTFLLMDFPVQPVFEFLQHSDKPMAFIEPEWNTGALGYGWPWNFYLSYYMPERSPFPVYGNVIIWAQRYMTGLAEDVHITYTSSYPGHSWPVEIRHAESERFEVKRPPAVNDYIVYLGYDGDRDLFVPFYTDGMQAALELLNDTLNMDIRLVAARPHLRGIADLPDLPGTGVLNGAGDPHDMPGIPGIGGPPDHFTTINSRASDSLFRPMMLYSDNFFAEQTLIMVSHMVSGVMDEKLLIDYLLENGLSEMPDQPRWVDGSGLSRYNLLSPRSLVWLLGKMKDEFGFERISYLLPTGGEGTLENFYLEEKGNIYAKTGTLGGNAVTLSGFLITGKGRTLIFSVLVNNYNKDSVEVRKAIENFIREIIYRY
jgi:serine-type D-Ala-D-Ala carboxypeptidase/endopeptidase (penicillin-binding protein 4)